MTQEEQVNIIVWADITYQYDSVIAGIHICMTQEEQIRGLFRNYWDNHHFAKMTEQYFKQSTYTLSAASKGTWAGLSYSYL